VWARGRGFDRAALGFGGEATLTSYCACPVAGYACHVDRIAIPSQVRGFDATGAALKRYDSRSPSSRTRRCAGWTSPSSARKTCSSSKCGPRPGLPSAYRITRHNELRRARRARTVTRRASRRARFCSPHCTKPTNRHRPRQSPLSLYIGRRTPGSLSGFCVNTLIGFSRGETFNVYSHPPRMLSRGGDRRDVLADPPKSRTLKLPLVGGSSP
jgi:hypothetical protein